MILKDKQIFTIILIISVAFSIIVIDFSLQNNLILATAGTDQYMIDIATNKLIGIVPLSVALSENLFSTYNMIYTLNFFPTGSQIAQSMLASQNDIGGPISTIDLIIIESINPGSFKLFSLLTENSSNPVSNILVKKDSAYKSIEDLRGKKLGIAHGAFWEFLSKILIKNHLNSMDAVQYVTIPPGSWISALETGKVDAIFSVEPYTTIAIQEDKAYSILNGAQSDVIKNIPIVGFAFNSNFVKENPTKAKEVVSIFDKSISIVKSDREKVDNSLIKYTGLHPNIVKKVKLNEYYNSSQLGQVESQLQEIADLLYEEGFMRNSVNVTNLLYQQQ